MERTQRVYVVTCRELDGHKSSYEFTNKSEAIGFLVRSIVIYSNSTFTFEFRDEK
jgi:hypothetical protein